MAETMGQRIQRIRHQKGWSQEQLGRRVDMGQQSIWRLEHDKIADPYFSTVDNLAAVLGVDPLWLVTGEEAEGVPKAPAPSSTGLGLLSEEERLVYDQAFGGLRWAMDHGLQENLISEDTIEDPEIKEDLDRLAQKMVIREIGRR